jgi:hypothetical protein
MKKEWERWSSHDDSVAGAYDLTGLDATTMWDRRPSDDETEAGEAVVG